VAFFAFVVKKPTPRDIKPKTQRRRRMHEGAEREAIYRNILDSVFIVHSEPEPGLLENAYEQCLYHENIRM